MKDFITFEAGLSTRLMLFVIRQTRRPVLLEHGRDLVCLPPDAHVSEPQRCDHLPHATSGVEDVVVGARRSFDRDVVADGGDDLFAQTHHPPPFVITEHVPVDLHIPVATVGEAVLPSVVWGEVERCGPERGSRVLVERDGVRARCRTDGAATIDDADDDVLPATAVRRHAFALELDELRALTLPPVDDPDNESAFRRLHDAARNRLGVELAALSPQLIALVLPRPLVQEHPERGMLRIFLHVAHAVLVRRGELRDDPDVLHLTTEHACVRELGDVVQILRHPVARIVHLDHAQLKGHDEVTLRFVPQPPLLDARVALRRLRPGLADDLEQVARVRLVRDVLERCASLGVRTQMLVCNRHEHLFCCIELPTHGTDELGCAEIRRHAVRRAMRLDERMKQTRFARVPFCAKLQVPFHQPAKNAALLRELVERNPALLRVKNHHFYFLRLRNLHKFGRKRKKKERTR